MFFLRLIFISLITIPKKVAHRLIINCILHHFYSQVLLQSRATFCVCFKSTSPTHVRGLCLHSVFYFIISTISCKLLGNMGAWWFFHTESTIIVEHVEIAVYKWFQLMFITSPSPMAQVNLPTSKCF